MMIALAPALRAFSVRSGIASANVSTWYLPGFIAEESDHLEGPPDLGFCGVDHTSSPAGSAGKRSLPTGVSEECADAVAKSARRTIADVAVGNRSIVAPF